ncbi:hypothetical protein M8494_10775 [Serratia ureilytica]
MLRRKIEALDVKVHTGKETRPLLRARRAITGWCLPMAAIWKPIWCYFPRDPPTRSACERAG